MRHHTAYAILLMAPGPFLDVFGNGQGRRQDDGRKPDSGRRFLIFVRRYLLVTSFVLLKFMCRRLGDFMDDDYSRPFIFTDSPNAPPQGSLVNHPQCYIFAALDASTQCPRGKALLSALLS